MAQTQKARAQYTALDRISCVRDDFVVGLTSSVRHVPLGSQDSTDLPLFDFEKYLDTIGMESSKQGVFESFTSEGKNTAKLDELLLDGNTLIAKLYSYRSCINGLPTAKADSTPEEKGALARAIREVLSPDIARAWDFMLFRDHAVKTVRSCMIVFFVTQQGHVRGHRDHLLYKSQRNVSKHCILVSPWFGV